MSSVGCITEKNHSQMKYNDSNISLAIVTRQQSQAIYKQTKKTFSVFYWVNL